MLFFFFFLLSLLLSFLAYFCTEWTKCTDIYKLKQSHGQSRPAASSSGFGSTCAVVCGAEFPSKPNKTLSVYFALWSTWNQKWHKNMAKKNKHEVIYASIHRWNNAFPIVPPVDERFPLQRQQRHLLLPLTSADTQSCRITASLLEIVLY